MTARQPNSSKPTRSKTKPMIPCSKEADIAEIKTKATDLEKIVKGNGSGQKGLQQSVIELNISVPQLTISTDILSGKVQTLLDRNIASDTERALKLSANQKMTAIITGIIGIATVLITITDMILKHL